MDLSIIIVSYNVKFFLEQCLHSVLKATKNIDAEIIIIDNNSVDGSCDMLRKKFPNLTLIKNKKNVGFSTANNQGIKIAKGKYVLLLNPDTIVAENTFEEVIGFMNKTPNAGGLGVKMIDGNGKFLPESKRGLPTPMVAFYKIFGLARLFPKSKKFGKYHLNYLDKNKTHKIDILSGACMFIRKEVLDKIGYLDETFFMYGEDIDLSYRITLAGYNNYYYPQTTIIHYKGESTKKGSINYVKIFYNAMIIFAKKHFGRKNTNMLIFFIKIAIYFRAFLAILKRIIQRLISPFIKKDKNKRIVVITNKSNSEQITTTLKNLFLKYDYVGLISPNVSNNSKYLGNINQLQTIINTNKINEVIFDLESMPVQQIINQMQNIKRQNTSFKIASFTD